jgi:DNA-binding SARP family transcriptional activator/DNA-binding beta-propeller fold protein YncE
MGAQKTVTIGNAAVTTGPLRPSSGAVRSNRRAMRYSILGPFEVHDGDQPVAVGGGRQRKLLALLLLQANTPVSSDRLIDELWGAAPTETAAKSLQGHVSQLRKRLGQHTVETVASGYALRLDAEQLDAARFERLLAEGGRLAPPEAAVALREALALWRGPPLPEFAYDDFARDEILRLEELHLHCLEERVDADLALGRHDDLIAELEQLVRKEPLRERLRAQLMLALYRGGRQADALDTYRQARAALRDELGLEPGEELQALQRQILAHDPALAAPARVAPARAAPGLTGTGRSRFLQPRVLIAVGVIALAAAAVAVGLEARGNGPATSVNVPANSIAMVDAKHNRVSAFVGVGVNPVAVALGNAAVWVANADDGTVDRLDPKTGKLDHTIGVGADLNDVATGFGSVWVADGNDGTVTRINPSINQIEGTIGAGGKLALEPSPVFYLAVDGRYVWATQGDELLRIDPATNRVDKRLTVGAPTGLAVGGGSVWVTTISERLLRIDATTMRLTASLLLSTGAFEPVFGGDSLWLILLTSRGQIEKFDPVSLATTWTGTTAGYPVALAFGDGALWAIDDGGGLSRFDQDGTVASTLHVGRHLTSIATGAGRTWVAVASPT